MITITHLKHLERLGIRPLTGEADNLGFRLLCDLTEEGKRVVEETYGVSCTSSNWNSGAVASCTLSQGSCRDLAIVGLVIKGHTAILTLDGGVYGLEDGEEFKDAEYDWQYPEPPKLVTPARIKVGQEWQDWPEDYYGKVQRVFRPNNNHPHAGTRNVHQMTGRTQ